LVDLFSKIFVLNTKKSFFCETKISLFKEIFLLAIIFHYESVGFQKGSLFLPLAKIFSFLRVIPAEADAGVCGRARLHTKISIFVFCVLMNDGTQGRSAHIAARLYWAFSAKFVRNSASAARNLFERAAVVLYLWFAAAAAAAVECCGDEIFTKGDPS
jgi:hypothetical protein